MPGGDKQGLGEGKSFILLIVYNLIVSIRIGVKGANLCPVKNHSPDILQLAYGDALRKFRKAIKLSQMKVADKAEVHFTYLSDIERGNRNLSLLNIVRIARALDVPLDKFFAEVEAQLARYSRPKK